MHEEPAKKKKSISAFLEPLEVGEAVYIEVEDRAEARRRMRQATTTERLKGDLKNRTFETSSFTAVPVENCPAVQYLVRVVRTS